MKLSEVITEIKSLIDIPDLRIGGLLEGESTALQFVSNASDGVTYSRDERRSLTLALLVKRRSQAQALDDSLNAAKTLMMFDELPQGDDWAITTIKYQTPILVEQEKSTKLWIYSTNIDLELNY